MPLRFRDVDLPDGERSVLALRVGDGAPVAEVSSLVEHAEPGALRVVLDADLGPVALSIDQTFTRTPGGLVAEHYVAESWNDDRLVTREEGHFPGREHLQPLDGVVGAFPAGLTPVVGAMTTLRGLDFAPGASGQVPVWLAFALSWPLEVRVERRETVRVPVGSVDAWRVVLRPSLAVLGPLRAVVELTVGTLLPEVVLHLAADDPHPLLRAEAPAGPYPWSPRAVLELTEIQLTG